MAERIIVPFCCLLCAFPFYMLAYLGKNSRKPMYFWSNGENKLISIVKDVPAYNREMAKLYRIVSLVFLVLAVLGAFAPLVCVILLLLCCTVGIWLLYRQYKKILGKYSDPQ